MKIPYQVGNWLQDKLGWLYALVFFGAQVAAVIGDRIGIGFLLLVLVMGFICYEANQGTRLDLPEPLRVAMLYVLLLAFPIYAGISAGWWWSLAVILGGLIAWLLGIRLLERWTAPDERRYITIKVSEANGAKIDGLPVVLRGRSGELRQVLSSDQSWGRAAQIDPAGEQLELWCAPAAAPLDASGLAALTSAAPIFTAELQPGTVLELERTAAGGWRCHEPYQSLTWVHVMVVDEANVPLAGALVAVRYGDGTLRWGQIRPYRGVTLPLFPPQDHISVYVAGPAQLADQPAPAAALLAAGQPVYERWLCDPADFERHNVRIARQPGGSFALESAPPQRPAEAG